MRNVLLSGLLLSLLAGAASAQTTFRATLDGTSVAPPVTTKAGGWATFTLNDNKTLTYFLDNQGLTGTAAHIHEGNPGQSGAILFTLSGGPDVYSGSTNALSDDQIAKLRGEDLYVDVHSAAFPDGQVRGQILMRPILFGAHLTGDQLVPPITTAALGDADFTVNSDRTLDYGVTINCGGGTAALLRKGDFGSNGDVLFQLEGGPSEWSGTTAPLSVETLNALQATGLYVEIQTLAHPEGEVRGQVVPSMAKYGGGCASSNGKVPALFGFGAPTPGGTLTVKVNNGLAGGQGILVQSPNAGAEQVSGCGFYLGSTLVFNPVRLTNNGELRASVVMPDISSFDLYLQFFGLDAATPNGFYSSNALYVPFTKF
jgi:hypothetical protein